MTAEKAMAEIWATLGPDCGPDDYEAVVNAVKRLVQPEDSHESKIVSDVRKLDLRRMPAIAALREKNWPAPDHLRACILELARAQGVHVR
jgi:hypothetical protein